MFCGLGFSSCDIWCKVMGWLPVGVCKGRSESRQIVGGFTVSGMFGLSFLRFDLDIDVMLCLGVMRSAMF